MPVPPGYTVPYDTSPATTPTPSPVSSPFDAGYRQPSNGGSNNNRPSSTPAPAATPSSSSSNWGSFGTYQNWANEFSQVHGRTPNRQDEADYWDSQIFASVVGRPPNNQEWNNRYWRGAWNLNEGGQFRGGAAWDESFPGMVTNLNGAPENLRDGIKGWIADIKANGQNAPSWLTALADAATAAWGGIAPTVPQGEQFGQNVPQNTTPGGTYGPPIGLPNAQASGGATPAPIAEGGTERGEQMAKQTGWSQPAVAPVIFNQQRPASWRQRPMPAQVGQPPTVAKNDWAPGGWPDLYGNRQSGW